VPARVPGAGRAVNQPFSRRVLPDSPPIASHPRPPRPAGIRWLVRYIHKTIFSSDTSAFAWHSLSKARSEEGTIRYLRGYLCSYSMYVCATYDLLKRDDRIDFWFQLPCRIDMYPDIYIC